MAERCRRAAVALAALAKFEDGTPPDSRNYRHVARLVGAIEDMLMGDRNAAAAEVRS